MKNVLVTIPGGGQWCVSHPVGQEVERPESQSEGCQVQETSGQGLQLPGKAHRQKGWTLPCLCVSTKLLLQDPVPHNIVMTVWISNLGAMLFFRIFFNGLGVGSPEPEYRSGLCNSRQFVEKHI